MELKVNLASSCIESQYKKKIKRMALQEQETENKYLNDIIYNGIKKY